MSVVFQGMIGEALDPDEVRVPCFAQLNLLAHAQLEELEIGSQCGGHGVCGGDRVRVTCNAGSVNALTEAERKHLSKAEIAAGWRLACQCYPQDENLDIAVAYRV